MTISHLAYIRLECTKCHEVKDVEDFTRDKSSKTGRHSHCRICHATDNRALYRKRPKPSSYWSKKGRRYYLNHREEVNKRLNGVSRTPAGVSRRRLKDAVRRGHIVKPHTCQQCGKRASIIDGHHKDYFRPLDVLWLCRACHVKRHDSRKLVSSTQEPT